jgi:hypothetical protein
MTGLQGIPDLREVSMPAAKILPTVQAWQATGAAPDRQRALLKKSWPRLSKALGLLVDGESGEWAEFEANSTIVALNEVKNGLVARVTDLLSDVSDLYHDGAIPEEIFRDLNDKLVNLLPEGFDSDGRG